MPNDFEQSRHDSGWDGQDRRNQPASADSANHPKGVRFDATINLGHILTFLGFILAGFTAWTTLDKRVTVIEERANLQAVVDRNQDTQLSSNMAAIRESLVEIKQQIARINDRQDRRSVP
ncbi:MAG: hypothetical protein WBK26_11205 [Burkholderiaceae bacterium]